MEWLITLSIYLLTGCIGMSVTYHRLLAHKSWKSSRPFEVFGTLLGFYGLTGSSIAWVAIHRQHHNHVDTPKDPHSPVHQPWWRVQFLSMFSPVRPECSLDLIKDPFHRFLHKYYFFIHALILLVLFLLSPKVAIAAYLAPACLLWHAGSAINTIGHMVGYKNFNTKDQSRNNWPLALLAWGEGWHNNHRPRRPNFGVKFWELDLSYVVIQITQKIEGIYLRKNEFTSATQ